MGFDHQTCLSRMCRICGDRLHMWKNSRARAYKPLLVLDVKDKIKDVYDVDVSADTTSIHPQYVCKKCSYNIKKKVPFTTLHRENLVAIAEKAKPLWQEHIKPLCLVCALYAQQSRGVASGYTNKMKRGKPKPVSKDTVISISPANNIISGSEDTTSDMCETPKQSAVHTTLSPVRSIRSPKDTVISITPDNNIISGSEDTTSDMCETPKQSAVHTTISPVRSIRSPLTWREEKRLSRDIKRKLHFSRSPGKLSIRTRGQPLTFVRVVRARRPTKSVSKITMKRRALQMATVRKTISARDVITQQRIELNTVPASTRETICQGVSVKSVTKELALALKSNSGTTWNQMRKIKRHFRTIGITFESEKKERMLQNEAIGNHLTGKMKRFYFAEDTSCDSNSGSMFKEVPYVTIKSLELFVFHMLNEYDNHNQLTWETNGIPEDEVWIKIGGDHGGDSFKLCLQILNINKPNSKENTHCIMCFPAKDTRQNLELAFDEGMGTQIKELDGTEWNGKKLIIFIFGDYDFLAKSYGLSGAASVHYCLWCVGSNADFQFARDVRGRMEDRNLENMTTHHCSFISESGGRRALAKHHFNVIHKHIFDIPIDRVCPPYLHIVFRGCKKTP